MKTLYFDFCDKKRNRYIPVAIYLPKNYIKKLPTVIFGPGYQGQKSIYKERKINV